MSGQICWKKTKYTGFVGSIGGIEIARISWTTRRDDATPWKLHVDLPGSRNEREFADSSSARDEAARLIEEFARLISGSVATE